MPLRRPARGHPAATDRADRQAQGQRGHGPPAAAHRCTPWSATRSRTAADRADDAPRAANQARASEASDSKCRLRTNPGEKDERLTCGGIFAASRSATTSHRVGDRDLPLFGPTDGFARSEQIPGPAGVPAGDRDSVNSARPTRTRFYSARSTRVGNATATSGDCVEMNSPAASPRSCDAGRTIRFRQYNSGHITIPRSDEHARTMSERI